MTSLSVVIVLDDLPEEVGRRTIRSLRLQSPADWEAVLVRPAGMGELPTWLSDLRAADTRLRLVDAGPGLPQEAGLADALGDLVMFLDYGTSLTKPAISELLDRADGDDADVIYADQRWVDAAGKKVASWRKPDWSPELLRGQPYLLGLVAYRRALVEAVGGIDGSFGPAWEYDLALRVTERARRVVHLDEQLHRVGYSDRVAWPRLPDGAAVASRAHLERVGIAAEVVEAPGRQTMLLRRRPQPGRRVSVVIPTIGTSGTVRGKDRVLVVDCVASILAAVRDLEVEIVVVYDPPTPPEVLAELEALAGERLQLIRYEKPFNFSDKCNVGALAATGDVLLFLNDDMEGIGDNWLADLVAPLDEEGVGATGAKLLFENDLLQHVGHAYGHRLWYHAFRKLADDSGADVHGEFSVNREVSGVTGAALAVRREVFLEVGGFSDELPNNYNDVDLCLKVRFRGYRILWIAEARLYHFESLSRETTIDASERAIITSRWGVPERDRYLPGMHSVTPA